MGWAGRTCNHDREQSKCQAGRVFQPSTVGNQGSPVAVNNAVAKRTDLDGFGNTARDLPDSDFAVFLAAAGFKDPTSQMTG